MVLDLDRDEDARVSLSGSPRSPRSLGRSRLPLLAQDAGHVDRRAPRQGRQERLLGARRRVVAIGGSASITMGCPPLVLASTRPPLDPPWRGCVIGIAAAYPRRGSRADASDPPRVDGLIAPAPGSPGADRPCGRRALDRAHDRSGSRRRFARASWPRPPPLARRRACVAGAGLASRPGQSASAARSVTLLLPAIFDDSYTLVVAPRLSIREEAASTVCSSARQACGLSRRATGWATIGCEAGLGV